MMWPEGKHSKVMSSRTTARNASTKANGANTEKKERSLKIILEPLSQLLRHTAGETQ